MKDVGEYNRYNHNQGGNKMAKKSKNARSIEKVDATKAYSVEEAVALKQKIQHREI